MRQEIKIEYNRKKARFELDVPYIMGGVARMLPSRAWNKAAKKWFAPAIRQNAIHIRDNLLPMKHTVASQEVVDAIAEAMVVAHSLNAVKFPLWYKGKTTLRRYQQDACDKLYGLDYGGLFAGVGTGKSLMSITLCSARAQDPDPQRNINAIIIACPFAIRNNWIKQLTEHSPVDFNAAVLDYQTKSGRKAFTELLEDDSKLRILIVGIESLSSGKAGDYVTTFAHATKSGFILDEASKIKNGTAKRTKKIIELGRLCKYRLALTGTAITKGIEDLYSQMEFLSSTIIGIGDFYSFKNQYMVMMGYECIGYKNTAHLLGQIDPYIYQILQEDALPELPERTYETRTVQLTPEQKKMYKQVSETSLLGEGETSIQITNALGVLLRLQQITGGFYARAVIDKLDEALKENGEPVKVVTENVPLKTNKLSTLSDIIDEADGSIIVWARFRYEIDIIAKFLKDTYGEASTVEFHGGISSDNRWDNVCKFEEGKARFFVGNPTVGGIGLDLLAANLVVYYSNDFSAETRTQSEARNFRMGQKKAVTYIDIITESTVDEHVMATVKQKLDVAAYVKQLIKNGEFEDSLRL